MAEYSYDQLLQCICVLSFLCAFLNYMCSCSFMGQARSIAVKRGEGKQSEIFTSIKITLYIRQSSKSNPVIPPPPDFTCLPPTPHTPVYMPPPPILRVCWACVSLLKSNQKKLRKHSKGQTRHVQRFISDFVVKMEIRIKSAGLLPYFPDLEN